MKLGKLRHRVAIEQVSETQDADSSVIETWLTDATKLAHRIFFRVADGRKLLSNLVATPGIDPPTLRFMD